MDAILVKTLLFLLIFGLVEFIVVEGGPYQMENKNGTMDGRFLIGNNLKRAHDEPGFRKSVQKDCQNTYSKEFFPKRTPPVGLRQNLGGIVLICQQKSRNEFKEGKETYYTTLFDQGLGIPVYSAYRLKSENTDYQKRCRPKWQENKGIRNQVGEHTYPQAPWQRGHLAPAHTLSSDKGAFRSTFRYTNAVPQRPSFNAGEWSKFERRIRKYAEVCTHSYNGELYLLSGTAFVSVDAEVKIDENGNVEGVSKGDEIETLPGEDNHHEIHVPKSLWTAGCCLSSYSKYTLESFAVIGNNVNEPGVMHTQQTSVAILQKILEQDSFTAEKVNLFPKNPACSSELYNLKKLPEYVKGDPNEEEEEVEEEEEEGGEDKDAVEKRKG